MVGPMVRDDDDPSEGETPEAEATTKRRKPAWLLPGALVAALGLVGVVTGGVVAYQAQSHALDGQQEVAAAQQRSLATGAARLMGVEFRGRADVLATAIAAKRLPRRHVSIATKVSPEDHRQVASALSATAWAAVAKAELHLGRAQGLLDRQPGGRLRKSDVASARSYRRSFGLAAKALAALG
ncbi:MAG: hypothetical protein QOK49_2602 [Baekduia sp.]|jgi:hypothetical protein|nr:hypothetical protein [Baekduia sp.]